LRQVGPVLERRHPLATTTPAQQIGALIQALLRRGTSVFLQGTATGARWIAHSRKLTAIWRS
jgi:hypothetical protein